MKIRALDIVDFKGISRTKLDNCGNINAIIGKNNSGKSSILHAFDIASLALNIRNWNAFQPKLEIKDLFKDTGNFSLVITYEDNSNIEIKTDEHLQPILTPNPNENQKFKSVLILPDVGTNMYKRRHRTPRWVIDQIESRNFAEVNSLEILDALKYYALRNERGLNNKSYYSILDEIKFYFPEITEVSSDRTEHDIATLTYKEDGHNLDILYSGSGLKHFLDVLLKTNISNAKIVLLDEPEMGLHPSLQRQFLEYLIKLSNDKNIQFFLATHSQVLLNYSDSVNYYKIVKKNGNRKLFFVPNESLFTLFNDLGIRPSDVFNQDISIMVEGATDVIFFDHLINHIYKKEFEKVSIGVIQYGGAAAEGILNGTIKLENIIPFTKYTYWFRDRDSSPEAKPSTNATKFKNYLEKYGLKCHILSKREIEFYFPRIILQKAQQDNSDKEIKVLAILDGEQKEKFRVAASKDELTIPYGNYLRRLLRENITSKKQIDIEIREVIEDGIIPWINEIY